MAFLFKPKFHSILYHREPSINIKHQYFILFKRNPKLFTVRMSIDSSETNSSPKKKELKQEDMVSVNVNIEAVVHFVWAATKLGQTLLAAVSESKTNLPKKKELKQEDMVSINVNIKSVEDFVWAGIKLGETLVAAIFEWEEADKKLEKVDAVESKIKLEKRSLVAVILTAVFLISLGWWRGAFELQLFYFSLGTLNGMVVAGSKLFGVYGYLFEVLDRFLQFINLMKKFKKRMEGKKDEDK